MFFMISRKIKLQSINLVELKKYIEYKKVICDFVLGKENFHLVFLPIQSNGTYSLDIFLNGPSEEVLTMGLFIRDRMPECVTEVYPC